MRKIFSLLCLTTFCISSFAQVTMIDTVVYNNFPKDNMTYPLKDSITNNTPNAITVSWSKTADLLLSGWTGIGMCDPIACYMYGAGSYSFTLSPGQTGVMYVDMKADTSATSGTSYVTLTTNYGDMVYKFVTAPPSCSAGFYIYEDTLAAPHTYIGVNTCIGNIINYDWSWGDGTPNSSGPYPSHTYAAAGVYNLCLMVSDNLNCTDTFCSNENVNKTATSWYTVTFNNPNSVVEKIKENIHLYPNPAKDILGITGENAVQYDVEIFNLNGAKLQSESFTTAYNSDISALVDGLYFIKINERGGTTRFMKFLKQ